MRKGLKVASLIGGVLIVAVGLWFTDNFVYPFKASNPNYSDVEAAFSKLQFPSDWKEISSSENRGLHGRGCDPVNSSDCFSKSKTFKIPETTTKDEVSRVLLSVGCTGLSEKDISQSNEKEQSINLSCSVGNGINIGSDLLGPNSEVYVSVKTY